MKRRKTGFLLCVCIAAGMVLGGCGEEPLEKIIAMVWTKQVDKENVAKQNPYAAEISNPVYHYTKESNSGKDTPVWSYVYFGSYPQSEVTEDELTEAIMGAYYDENGDTVVDGVKYRRVNRSDVNNAEFFGKEEYRYFIWESVKWRVLQNNGSTLFVMADQGLDCQYYDKADMMVMWKNCTLRSWLNNEFFQTVFDNNEQAAVVGQMVVNEDNFVQGTDGGDDSLDRVYLLSIGEVVNLEYGFCDYNDEDESGSSCVSRLMQTSDYAYAMGASMYEEYGDNACKWWLRSPGINNYNASIVDSYGSVNCSGVEVNADNYAVVPALHINLSSDLWTVADESQQ